MCANLGGEGAGRGAGLGRGYIYVSIVFLHLGICLHMCVREVPGIACGLFFIKCVFFCVHVYFSECICGYWCISESK